MAEKLDKKIVELELNNQNFEKNSKKTIKTIDNLDNKLQFKNATDGLNSIDKESKRITFDSMSQAINKVQMHFSALEIFSIQALSSIYNKIINISSSIARAFTIDPVKTGFQEYETQINAIQTILANTQSAGTTLGEVTSALDELNEYADKTIYNFTEMTRNIGTFTAAGIGLNESKTAIQGIANLAAVSGSTAQQASSAMYQLSQALSSGTVKLQDWNSVVNAGMGGSLFQEALKKTARTHGIAVDKMIREEGSFRESLKRGWITSEILLETLQKMTQTGVADYLSNLTGVELDQIKAAQKAVDENKDGLATYDELADRLASTGKISRDDAIEMLKMADTATNAATKVKTLTQLVDTLKEAAQSGWTKTWEIVIGDFDESKSLLTSISDVLSNVINKTSEYRNNLLQGWKDLGGRTLLINSFKNIFESLGNILKEIGKAFKNVFPPITSQHLLKITEYFNKFTEKIKVTPGALEKINKVFTVFFTITKKVLSVMAKLVVLLYNLARNIKNAAAPVKDWIADSLANIKASEKLSNVLEKLSNAIEKIKNKFISLKKSSEDVGDNNKINKISKATSKLDGLSKKLDKIKNTINKIIAKLKPAIKSIGKNLAEAFRKGDVNTFIKTFNSAMITSGLIGIRKSIKSISKATNEVTKIIKEPEWFKKNIESILNSVRGCFEKYQEKINAGILMTIAKAVALLAASLFVLSLLNPERLKGAIGAITLLFAELIGSLKLYNSMKFNTFDDISSQLNSLIKTAAAVYILASAVNKIGKLSPESLRNSLLVISVLLGEMLFISSKLKNLEKIDVKGSLGVAFITEAIGILADSVRKIGTMKLEDLGKGLLGVTALLIILTTVAIELNKSGERMIKGTTGLLIMAAAVTILGNVVQQLGTMKLEDLGKGLLGVAALLIMLTAVSIELNKSGERMIKGTVGLVIIAAAIKILASVVKTFANMDIDKLVTGLGGLAITMAALVLSAIAIGGLGGKLVVGAAGLLVMSTALLALLPVIKVLGSMELPNIIKAVLSLAGAIIILAGTAALLSPLVIPMLAIGGALMLLAGSVYLAGKGLLVLAGALTVFATSGSLLLQGVPVIIDLIVTSFVTLLEKLVELAPRISKAAADLTIAFLEGLGENMPRLILAANAFIVSFINGLADGIRENYKALSEAIGNLCLAIIEIFVDFFKIDGDESDKLKEIGKKIINGIIVGIANKYDEMKESMHNAGQKMLDKAKEFPDWFKETGKDIIESIKNGIKSKIEDLKDSVVSVGKTALNALKDFLDINSPSKEFYKIGAYSSEGYINALDDGRENVYKSSLNLGKSAEDGLNKSINNINSLFSDDIDLNPVISPVLDLSNIQSGSTKISDILNGPVITGKLQSNLNAISSGLMIRNQNAATNNDIVSAIDKLKTSMSEQTPGNTYNLNGISYNDDTPIANAVSDLIKAIEIEGRA